MRKTLIGLCLLLLPLRADAATLSGFVTDRESGESLLYANVSVRGTSLGALTNPNGYYAVRAIPPGVHVVVFSFVGYETRRDTVSVTGVEDIRRNVALSPRPIALAGETVVAADRYEQERAALPSFLTVPAQTLRNLPAVVESDLLRSLALLPGVQTASDISSGLYIRGGGPDQTLILLDQIPVYNPSHAFGFFSTFNPDAIKDVNLYKGAYPAQYGGNLGSVLDVSNRDGNRNALHGTGGVSLISARLMLEGPVKEGSWMLSGRRTYLEPILSAIRSRTTEIPAYYFYDLNARVNQELGGSDRFVASGYLGRDDLHLDLDEGSFVNVRWGNTAFTGKWTHVFSPSVFGNFVTVFSRYTSDTSVSFFDTPILFSNSIRDLSVKGDIDWFASGRHTLTGGFWATRYDFSFRQVFNQQEQQNLRLSPVLLALYAQDEWRLPQATTVRLGGRSTFFSAGRRLNVEPRLSVSHALKPDLRLKLAGGVYHQYLQFVTTEGFSGGDFWVPLDATVRPGRSWQSVAGVEWEPSARYQVSLEGYYTRLENLVVLDNSVAPDAEETRSDDLFRAGGRGHATGMEVFVQRRTGALTGWIGYTLGWTRRRFPELNQGRAFPPKYDRRHDLSLVAGYRRGRWTFGGSLVYATGQAYTPAAARYSLRAPATGLLPDEDDILPAARNSARLLPYHRLDLSVRRDFRLFGRSAQWFVQVFNVYSRRNEWFIQYNTENPATEPKVVKMLPIVPTFGLDLKF